MKGRILAQVPSVNDNSNLTHLDKLVVGLNIDKALIKGGTPKHYDKASISNSALKDVEFSDYNLSEFSLKNTRLDFVRGFNLEVGWGSNFENVVVNNLSLTRTNSFGGSNFDGIIANSLSLQSNFSNCKFNKIFIADSDIYQTRFDNSVLSGEFNNVKFREVSFSNSLLENVKFIDCEFVDCLFSGSDITDCLFDDCDFKDTEFLSSNVNDTSFKGLVAESLLFNSSAVDQSTTFDFANEFPETQCVGFYLPMSTLPEGIVVRKIASSSLKTDKEINSVNEILNLEFDVYVTSMYKDAEPVIVHFKNNPEMPHVESMYKWRARQPLYWKAGKILDRLGFDPF